MALIDSFLKKNNLKTGDFVQLNWNKQLIEGTIFPAQDSDTLVLKLASGYNVGLKTENISNIKKIKSQEKTKQKQQQIKSNPNLPALSIIHTGGTIASRVDYKTGAVIPSFTPEDLFEMFPDLNKIANLNCIFFGNILSENISFKIFSKIAQEIKKEIDKGVKGIIVTHGTDTMHYSAAALSFMFENLPVPIIFVGAQRSSDRGSSDSNLNLLSAAKFITETNFTGVALCMHSSMNDDLCNILPATNSRKLHSSRRDAFKPVNALPLASIDFNKNKISKKSFPTLSDKLVFRPKLEEKVALLKSYPNLSAEQIDFFKKNKFKGLIFEGTGLGHLPVLDSKENEKILTSIKSLVKSGCIVAMSTQTIFGRVDMNVYSAGRILADAGVLSCENMLSETALLKLAWLLGNFKPNEAKKLLSKNLRGEISSKSDIRQPDLN